MQKKSCYDWCDWLINHIPKAMEIMGGAKDKSMILLKTDTTKDYSKLTLSKMFIVVERNQGN